MTVDIATLLASASARPAIMLPLVPGKATMTGDEYAAHMSALVPLYDPGKGEGRAPLELLFAEDYRKSLRGHTSPYTGSVMETPFDAIDHCFAMGYIWGMEDQQEKIDKEERRKKAARDRTNKWREEHTAPELLAARNELKAARAAKAKAMEDWDAHIDSLRARVRELS